MPTSGCKDGFSGENCEPACEIDSYAGQCTVQCDAGTTCNGNGRCRGMTGTCECYEGWAGPNCACPHGFTGDDCSQCDDCFTGHACECEPGSYSLKVHVTPPAPTSEWYHVSIVSMNADFEIGEISVSKVDMIGRPLLLSRSLSSSCMTYMSSIDSPCISTLEWGSPNAPFWHIDSWPSVDAFLDPKKHAVIPLKYVVEVSCSSSVLSLEMPGSSPAYIDQFGSTFGFMHCTDLPGGASLGYNGCDGYIENEGWCDLFDGWDYLGGSSALDMCCACGFGKNTVRSNFLTHWVQTD